MSDEEQEAIHEIRGIFNSKKFVKWVSDAVNTVSVLGCCTSRDIFSDKQDDFKVQQCITIASPMSNFLPKPEHPMKREDLAGFRAKAGLNYRSRVTILDSNKACFDYIGEKTSDYIIVDIADVRLSIARYGERGTLSYTNFIVANRKEFERIFGRISIQEFDKFSEREWEMCMRHYCKCILKYYDVERIVLNEVVLQNEYVTRQGFLRSFSSPRRMENQKINRLLERLFHVCEEELEGCHVVRMPRGTIADASHKFGLYPLHFHRMYYEYGLRAMKIVADGLPEKKRRLSILCEEYGNKFSMLRLCLENKGYAFENHKLTEYVEYFLYLVQHPVESLRSVKAFLGRNKIKHVALFGDFKTTEALMFYLKEAGGSVDYIIGLWSYHKELKLVPPLKSGKGSYPRTDAIINCSIMNLKNGSESLRKTTAIPVFDIYDVLPKGRT